MKYLNLSALVCLSVAAFAQDVQFDYDRSANFNAYQTYQWVDYGPVRSSDQLLDQNIKRAVRCATRRQGLTASGERRGSYDGISGGDLAGKAVR